VLLRRRRESNEEVRRRQGEIEKETEERLNQQKMKFEKEIIRRKIKFISQYPSSNSDPCNHQGNTSQPLLYYMPEN